MAIRGTLAEAGLAEVLQLLALGQKRGCLHAARADDCGVVYLDEGRITHASLARRPNAAVDEAVFELLTWTRGSFRFEPDVRAGDATALVSLDVPGLLMEGARRSDEQARIDTRVGGDDSIYAFTERAPCTPAGALDVERVAWGDAVLSASERTVAAAIDGRRDVAAIADATAVGNFAVRRTLFVLAELGLVEAVGTSVPRTVRDASRVLEHRNLGVAFYRAGLLDEAAREFRRVLALLPGDVHAQYFVGAIALRAGDGATAVRTLTAAAAAPGAHGAVFQALAAAHAAAGHVGAAHAALDEAERRGLASHPRLRALRASLLLRTNDLGGARGALGDDDARPMPAVWHHYAALAAARRGDPRAAGGALIAAHGAAPRAAPVLANLAALAVHTGALDSALDWAARALDEDASLAPAHKTVGDVHYRVGRHRDAAMAFERALALAPALGAESWLRLGNVRLRDGDRRAAVAAWRQAVTLRPDHAIARANLESVERDGAGAQPL